MEAAGSAATLELDGTRSEPCRLRLGEIHVYFASLRLSTEARKTLHGSLSADERSRAAAFRNPRGRDDFIAMHGIGRELLARYAGTSPNALRFEADRRGKPRLGRSSGGRSIEFSMSRSGTAALYGVAKETSIGVDLEFIDPARGVADALLESLSSRERALLDTIPRRARLEALFRFWTLKEAYLKARGSGFAIPPSAIDVSAALSADSKVLVAGENAEVDIPWTFAVIPAPPCYAAAAAWRGSRRRIVCGLFDGQAMDPSSMNISARCPS
jgi:4'-phosphopantetheinyl transferase